MDVKMYQIITSNKYFPKLVSKIHIFQLSQLYCYLCYHKYTTLHEIGKEGCEIMFTKQDTASNKLKKKIKKLNKKLTIN